MAPSPEGSITMSEGSTMMGTVTRVGTSDRFCVDGASLGLVEGAPIPTKRELLLLILDYIMNQVRRCELPGVIRSCSCHNNWIISYLHCRKRCC